MTTMEYETPTNNYDDAPNQPRRQRRGPRLAPMHEDISLGPILAAHVRQHADQVEADASSEGADPRLTEATVSLLRRWAAEIEGRLHELHKPDALH